MRKPLVIGIANRALMATGTMERAGVTPRMRPACWEVIDALMRDGHQVFVFQQFPGGKSRYCRFHYSVHNTLGFAIELDAPAIDIAVDTAMDDWLQTHGGVLLPPWHFGQPIDALRRLAAVIAARETLTPKQARMLAAVIAHQRKAGGTPPSIRQLAKSIGLSSTDSVHRYLVVLVERGYLEHSPHAARSYRLAAPYQELVWLNFGWDPTTATGAD